MVILIDVHEPKELKETFRKLHISFREEPLEVGDFTNTEDTFIVERKSFRDFWSSLIDARINDQVRRMEENYKKNRYVFVEYGSLMDLAAEQEELIRKKIKNTNATNWIYDTFGMIENWGSYFREYDSYEDLARKLVALDKNLGSARVIREKKKKYRTKSTPVKILATVPSIGEKKADDIIQVFKTVEDVLLEAKTEGRKILEIKGVGQMNLKEIREAFGLTPDVD